MSGVKSIITRDVRLSIGCGHASDAIHRNALASCAATLRQDDESPTSTLPALTLGAGNQLVCEAARCPATARRQSDRRNHDPLPR